ncbi:hypothetical protein SAE02_27150 [Skermanella aerolata]|uniref:DUF1398 domain-containing protein n=1 Tax=Skermanella aerolata TaxID=393310 RepID=A0A512DQ05_9PROT|nr:hypothetical protein [Skermanella aerolata]KJB92747.1 hypothetical protein N826_21370 [Skermanella aerolata KACC 11604]GEO38567.1 hypothetical protein SAE02_27150 [Skermanella aerolata]
MDAERISIAQSCLDAAHDGSLGFPAIVGKLIAARFEGYTVDYRRNTQTYYLPDGDSVALDMPHSDGITAATFDAAAIEGLVRWAQRGEPDYSYSGFCEKAKGAGCAGYLVSFLGRRVVYFGRTAETHIERFPE